MCGPSIVDSRQTAGAAKGRNAFDVDALVTSTTGETNGIGPDGDYAILALHEAEVAASA
jgi:hypothetical protein